MQLRPRPHSEPLVGSKYPRAGQRLLFFENIAGWPSPTVFENIAGPQGHRPSLASM